MTGLGVRRYIESVLGVGRFCWKKYQVFGFSLGWGEMFGRHQSSQLLFLISFYYLAIGKSLKFLERVSGMVRCVLFVGFAKMLCRKSSDSNVCITTLRKPNFDLSICIFRADKQSNST